MSEEIKNSKSKIAEREEEILKFWQDNKIFEKSLKKPSKKGDFVFYDGPPFATGLPHYGHILAGTIKDVIPRYKTMKGYFVPRVWGWDCHGLPIENMIEKELGLETKKDIEKYGIEKFNKAARSSVFKYEAEWKKIIPRVGRWVDMDHSYKTMDSSYTESVWWSFKKLYEKGLVYEGFKSMHLCPRCGTTLSNFEVNQGYREITDISVYVKFKLKDKPDTCLLAWTTTPWTLPGNVALAINPKEVYVEVEMIDGEKNEKYILASKRLESIKTEYKILREMGGEDLVGTEYIPLFDYYANENFENKKNAWKVYGAGFVTMEDGTGVVHIAPAFGEDDLNLALKEGLPIIRHVNQSGEFEPEVTDFAGMLVKPKDNHQKADVEIIKNLAHKKLLFDKEKIVHSYPHCWRCDTPLLNYATSSWFVKVTEIKEKMMKLNSNIKWVPEEIGENRFGKWLEGARDWAVSRSRYWGAPLPVWKDKDGKVLVIGSIPELKEKTQKSGNKYFTMRHGEAEQNIGDTINSDPNNIFHLTEEGKRQVQIAAEDIKSKKIDLIISSPFDRCKETAEIVRNTLGLDNSAVVIEERLGEFKKGRDFEGKKWDDYWKLFKNTRERFEKAPDGGENLFDLNKRVGNFLYEIEKKYSDKNILLVSHDGPISAMHMVAEGAGLDRCVEIKDKGIYRSGYAELLDLDFTPLSHDENYALDLHRPYIDEIKLVDKKGEELKRVEYVFDTWYDSGSMPYAQVNYPFAGKEEFEAKNSPFFPADFIAEGLDQTRGWFYTMLVLSTGLFGKSPYGNVIVNGIVLAEDGQKMSKRLKNYPDPTDIINKYGADALRQYLLSSPVVRSEDLAFSERSLDEVSKKLILRMENVLAFFIAHKEDFSGRLEMKNENVLDKWVVSRLAALGKQITDSLDSYELDKAARPIMDFVDDLSTWYIRRSRDRFKSADLRDRTNALATTRFVLLEFSKYIAPFIPFLAERIYQKLKDKNDSESVHLCDWPVFAPAVAGEAEVLENMEETRKTVSLALEKRMSAGIKVRQPLKSLKIKNKKLENKEEYLGLIKDEINVKEVIFDENIDGEVELDTEITPELQKEGNVREFIRTIQDLRKEKNLIPSDSIDLLVETDNIGQMFLREVEAEIKKPTNLREILFTENRGVELNLPAGQADGGSVNENMSFRISLILNT